MAKNLERKLTTEEELALKKKIAVIVNESISKGHELLYRGVQGKYNPKKYLGRNYNSYRR